VTRSTYRLHDATGDDLGPPRARYADELADSREVLVHRMG
jgi:hypothetical protein